LISKITIYSFKIRNNWQTYWSSW